MVLRLIIAFLLLAACTPGVDVFTHYDDWTGFTDYTTPEAEIFRDSKAIMTVRPVVVARDGIRGFGVLTNIRRRVPNGPIIKAVYSGNIPLQYKMHDRIWSHCMDGCQRAEVGVIYMTQEAFRIAARTGLPLRIQGRRGRYAGTVPAALFQDVLAGL